MKQRTSKDAIAFILCGPPTASRGASILGMVCVRSETPLEKTKFLFVRCYLLEIDSGLGMQAYFHFSSQCWKHIWCRPV